MSLPAHRPPGTNEDLPPDLADLRARYRTLPHQSVRYDTDIGDAFKVDLERAYGYYSVRELAETLGISPQGVSYILNRRRALKPRRWPGPDDLRRLRSAWRVAVAASLGGTAVGRGSTEYAAVYLALDDLLEEGFDLQEIALSLGVITRRLGRFMYPPLMGPEQLARVVREILDHPEAGEPDDSTC